MSNITKIALATSLKTLLEKNTLDKITINDITEYCGINRMTFYYHFQDIYDLLEWSFEMDAKKVVEGNKTITTWQEGYKNILNALKENPNFVYHIYNSLKREQLENYLYKITSDFLGWTIKEMSKNMTVKEEDKNEIVNIYKYAFVGVTLDFIKNNMMLDVNKLVDKMSNILTGTFNKALENVRLDKPKI